MQNDNYNVELQPDEGAFIYGLFLEGGRWSRDLKCLVESEMRILSDEMPIVSKQFSDFIFKRCIQLKISFNIFYVQILVKPMQRANVKKSH